MTGRNGEVRFEYWPDQPPSTQAGGWRARLAQSHFGHGDTIESALFDLAQDINREAEAVERARVSIRDQKVKPRVPR
jgi:hypothetical protein